jgi:hypothetical protein
MKNTRLWNGIFSALIFTLYIIVMVRIYISVGFYEWNFQNILPVANVSPFMFALALVMHIFPQKIKKHIYLLISLLSVGMLLSATFNCIYNASINYKFHVHFLCDYLAHILLSLWGIYQIKSKQVTLCKKNSLISGAIIFGVAFTMLILNLIFDTAFFGLSLNGKHNIYNVVITKSSALSALVYFVGLGVVLLLGYFFSLLFAAKKSTQGTKNE